MKTALEGTRPPGGGTDIAAGVYAGNQVLIAGADSHRPRFQVLLTDGQSGYDHNATQQAIDNGIIIDTIGLGSADENLLRQIANETGGEYRHVSQASEIPAVYQSLLRDGFDDGTDTDGDGLTDCQERHGSLIATGFYSLRWLRAVPTLRHK